MSPGLYCISAARSHLAKSQNWQMEPHAAAVVIDRLWQRPQLVKTARDCVLPRPRYEYSSAECPASRILGPCSRRVAHPAGVPGRVVQRHAQRRPRRRRRRNQDPGVAARHHFFRRRGGSSPRVARGGRGQPRRGGRRLQGLAQPHPPRPLSRRWRRLCEGDTSCDFFEPL